MAAISITAADVLRGAKGNSVTYLAAVSITAGEAVYLLANGTTVGLAAANGATPANTVLGIAENAGGAGQPISVRISDPAFVFGGAATAGQVIYLSETAGAITDTYADLATSDAVIILGICNTGGSAGTATMNLNPSAFAPVTHG